MDILRDQAEEAPLHCNPKPYAGAYYISGANTNNNRKYGDPDTNHQGRLFTHHQFYLFSTPCFIICPCFIIPDPHLPCLSDPTSCDLLFWTIIHCDFLSIKATATLYYTSVLISTKITTVFSLWDPPQTSTERSEEIEGPRLPVGTTHKLKPSPSIQPEPWNVYIPFGSTSYVLVPYQILMWISS